MRLEGRYDPRADIAWLRVDDQDDGTALNEETARDVLRAFSRPSGRSVGVAVKHARRSLPSEFLKMLRQVPSATHESTPRAPRHSSGLAHHQRLKQLHDAWG